MSEEIKSPVKAIRAFCLECCGGSAADVRDCTSSICALKPFRFGKNPYIHREMTEEQRKAASDRLKKARENQAPEESDEVIDRSLEEIRP